MARAARRLSFPLLVVLWVLPACPRPPPEDEAPEAAAPAAPAPRAETDAERSQRLLEASLAKLEALRAAAEDAGAPAAALATHIEVREPSGVPAAVAPDAGARASRWGEVNLALGEQRLAEAVTAARLALAQDHGVCTAECVAGFGRLQGGLRGAALLPWDASALELVDAVDQLPESEASIRPALPQLWVRLAEWAQHAHQPTLARRYARRALDLEEETAAARLVLAALAYDESDFDEAQSQWERALRLEPANRSIQQRLEHLAKERQRFGTGRKSSTHFVVSYDARTQEEVAKFTLEALEQAWTSVGAVYGEYPEAVLTVVLYSDQDFDSVKHVSWAGGLYNGKVRVPTGRALTYALRFKQTLFHEYGHGLFHRAAKDGVGRAPAWLNEGLSMLAGNVAAPVPLGGCRAGHTFPLQTLATTFGALSSREAHPAYLEARHAVEQLQARFGEDRVRALVRALGKHRDFPRAFESELGVAFSKWQQEYDAEAGR